MLRRSIVLSVVLAGCQGQTEPQNSQTKSIIDQNSMVEIDKDTPLPNKALKEDFGAIGRMTGGCTAFHLGHGIVATAGHCLESLKPNPLENSCYALDITWGLLADEPNAGRSRCMQVLDMEYDQQADYALIQVDPVPATALALQTDPRDMKSGTETVVVGYPTGKALSLSGTCGATTALDPDSKIFHHHCDTLPGNSGSPVMDVSTSKVIGVHNGDADNEENYGSYLPAPEVLGPLAGVAQLASPLPSTLQFGPFDNQLRKTLVNFTSQQADFVSFQLLFDVEDGYDKVVVIDGIGRLYEHTGLKNVSYARLPTPVSVVVLTDYAGPSASVSLEGIQSH